MADIEDCTIELFDSSVFVEAIADTSGKKDDAKEAINDVKTAENRIPIAHELIIGEVREFITSEDSFEDEVSRELAERDFQRLLEGFRFIEIDLEDFIDGLEYISEEKTRIASEFNDSLIVGIALSKDAIDKIHTTDDWSLRDRDTKINSI
ncbi:MAG: type II toxin-antitoxin system VapC family toxin [Candidatus Nanohaloarchaea archaeon]